MDTRNDSDLIDVCNGGDSDEAARAFETLYTRHKEFVIRVALRFVPDNDAALDVLQETFAYLLSKFPPAGPGLTLTSKLTTLLYPAAKNSALTLKRKAERFPPSETTAPDDLRAASDAAASQIHGLLQDLPEERREIILLRFVDEMSLQEIAAALDIPLGTVKSRLHLAIKQLRDTPGVKNMLSP